MVSKINSKLENVAVALTTPESGHLLPMRILWTKLFSLLPTLCLPNWKN